jgi:hypothetical protein
VDNVGCKHWGTVKRFVAMYEDILTTLECIDDKWDGPSQSCFSNEFGIAILVPLVPCVAPSKVEVNKDSVDLSPVTVWGVAVGGRDNECDIVLGAKVGRFGLVPRGKDDSTNK